MQVNGLVPRAGELARKWMKEPGNQEVAAALHQMLTPELLRQLFELVEGLRGRAQVADTTVARVGLLALGFDVADIQPAWEGTFKLIRDMRAQADALRVLYGQSTEDFMKLKIEASSYEDFVERVNANSGNVLPQHLRPRAMQIAPAPTPS